MPILSVTVGGFEVSYATADDHFEIAMVDVGKPCLMMQEESFRELLVAANRLLEMYETRNMKIRKD